MSTARPPAHRQHGDRHDTAKSSHPASPGSNATLPKVSPKSPPGQLPDEVRDFPSGNPEPKGNYK